jgi:hypothetical protein
MAGGSTHVSVCVYQQSAIPYVAMVVFSCAVVRGEPFATLLTPVNLVLALTPRLSKDQTISSLCPLGL